MKFKIAVISDKMFGDKGLLNQVPGEETVKMEDFEDFEL